METNVKIVGFANQSFNGKSVSSKGFDINYDGNIADVNAFSDGKVYYMRLANEDIQNLLNIPSSSQSLEENLISHYGVRPKQVKCQIVKYSRKRPQSHKKIKLRIKPRKTVRIKSKPLSRSYSRGKSTKRVSQRTLTPYYKPYKSSSNSREVPSIERTIY